MTRTLLFAVHACMSAYCAFMSYDCRLIHTQVKGMYLGILLSDCAGTARIEELAEEGRRDLCLIGIVPVKVQLRSAVCTHPIQGSQFHAIHWANTLTQAATVHLICKPAICSVITQACMHMPAVCWLQPTYAYFVHALCHAAIQLMTGQSLRLKPADPHQEQ